MEILIQDSLLVFHSQLDQGLIASAGVTGMMPLTMPESVLVKFTGELQLELL